MVDDASMSAPGPERLITVHARASYQALARTPPLRIAVALTTFLPPAGGEVGPEATAEFAVEQSFALWVAAFEGELPRSWAGHEIHSRHQRITTPTADVIAAAEGALDYPRWACRALAGHEDWAEEPPAGRYYGHTPGQGEDLSAGGCQIGGLNGWWLHFQAPSSGDFELSAAVVRRRQDPRSEDAIQLGTVSVHITLT